jgi:hypothetical protein
VIARFKPLPMGAINPKSDLHLVTDAGLRHILARFLG